MLKPRPLKAGDRIAVVSPASPFDRDEFDRGVKELGRLGYVPVYDESVFARSGYLAGPADVRAAAFIKAWSDPTVAALIAVRGGYGSVHMLPFLDPAVIRVRPKLFVGYSDTTTLLSWLTCTCGVTALHGPMLEGRLAKGSSGYDEASFIALLQDGRGLELSPPGVTVLRDGEATGPLFGGTLTQLVASLGTPYAFDPPRGAVLFLEDVNERPFRIDRMLTQLRLSGVLERSSALVFGEMPGCDEPGGAPTALETLGSFLGESGGPVLAGFPSGHAKGPIWTLPLGVTVKVVTRPKPAVIVEEAPVE